MQVLPGFESLTLRKLFLFQMYFVYILFSSSFNRYYTGHTDNLPKRLKDHNNGKVRSTRAYRLWVVIHTETYKTKSEAYKREMQIKSYKKGEAFKKLINH